MSYEAPTASEQAIADANFDMLMLELEELAVPTLDDMKASQSVAEAVMFGARMRLLYATGKPNVYFTPPVDMTPQKERPYWPSDLDDCIDFN